MSFNLNDALKNRIVIILAILSAILFFSTLSSCGSAMRQKASRDKEMASRLALEERMSKFSQDRSALEEKAKAKEKEAEELKPALETANKALAGERLINQSLKEELDKVVNLKEALENDLKKAKEEIKKLKK
ncbi:MAG: hypothetical protein PHR84_02820 [Candidatus Omnitrophica bacterium]|nr:hypothetical protein [Candidatus Omnitrophota bacterium]MDD5660721.1 hypothetical protein [Candidatus Omnitrophota bacterium]